MNALAAGTVVLAAWSACLPAAAAQDDPARPPPPPGMEPEKLGPHTEVVDLEAYASVFHVAPGGPERGDGSQARPFAAIPQALARASDAGETRRHAILVAAGEYRDETVMMKPHVDLFGGFDAHTWRRDLEAHRTVLDGGGRRRVVAGADHARLDGFVIRNGKVRGPGAGVLCDHASPTISNNTIIDNATLEPEGVHRELIHQRGNDGAAIACLNGSSGTIANNLIAGNTTEIGGGAGIAIANFSMPRLLNNVITGNETGLTDRNLSRSSNGAAISATNAQHRPPLRMEVVNNLISNNRAGGKSDAGGIYLEYDSSPIVAANWIVGNWCEDDGSAMYVMKASHPLFAGNIVAGNNSSAVRLSKEGRGVLENNLIFGNAAAVVCISSWMDFRHNTIVDNASGLGYGNPYAPHLKPSLITANLIYGNQGGQLGAEKGAEPPLVAGNDIQGGYAAGEGNFDEKPQFADDGVKGTIASLDYDPLRGVTAIAAADPPAGGGALAGRVVSIGDRWGLIRSAAAARIIVWGDLRPRQGQATVFTIAPTYRLRAALAGDVGRHPKP